MPSVSRVLLRNGLRREHLHAEVLIVLQVVLMGAAESYRNAGEAPGVEGLDPLYPVCPGATTLLFAAAVIACAMFDWPGNRSLKTDQPGV